MSKARTSCATLVVGCATFLCRLTSHVQDVFAEIAIQNSLRHRKIAFLQGSQSNFKTAAFNHSATHPIQAIKTLIMPSDVTKRGVCHPIRAQHLCLLHRDVHHLAAATSVSAKRCAKTSIVIPNDPWPIRRLTVKASGPAAFSALAWVWRKA